MDKKWKVEDIKQLLKTNDKILLKSILIIYSFQTEDEKESNDSCHDNGFGFNALDAEIMCDFAKGIIKYKHLTFKQLCIARKIMPKYAKQLTKVANKEIEVNLKELKED